MFSSIYLFQIGRRLIFELICDSAKIYAFQESIINLLVRLSMFYFCLNTNSPTVASPYHFFLEEHMFCAQRPLWGREFAIGLVLVILCEPVKVETESRNFSEAQRVVKWQWNRHPFPNILAYVHRDFTVLIDWVINLYMKTATTWPDFNQV